ncbi:hypothetical protein RJ639_032329 [Escallonia herrerae]|uniref:Uncharacterized protein n=1 Tax=Escallonia herrerae TaxID=1293975 RepID=A0AA88WX26_9ASTE|nr:hypothetical protein RJ639_032329 [Escallonia herrerae]
MALEINFHCQNLEQWTSITDLKNTTLAVDASTRLVGYRSRYELSSPERVASRSPSRVGMLPLPVVGEWVSAWQEPIAEHLQDVSQQRHTDASQQRRTASSCPRLPVQPRLCPACIIRETHKLTLLAKGRNKKDIVKNFTYRRQVLAASQCIELGFNFSGISLPFQVRDVVCLESIMNPSETIARGIIQSTDPSIQVGGKNLGRIVAVKKDERLIRSYEFHRTIYDTYRATVAWPCPYLNKRICSAILDFALEPSA